MNVKLSYEELQIILQCMQQLNYSGQHVREIGMLLNKIHTSIKKIESKKTTE